MECGPNMPPSTPHGPKECIRCKATKPSDDFIDRRNANGVSRITLTCDACRAKRAQYARLNERNRSKGKGRESNEKILECLRNSISPKSAAELPKTTDSRGGEYCEEATFQVLPASPGVEFLVDKEKGTKMAQERRKRNTEESDSERSRKKRNVTIKEKEEDMAQDAKESKSLAQKAQEESRQKREKAQEEVWQQREKAQEEVRKERKQAQGGSWQMREEAQKNLRQMREEAQENLRQMRQEAQENLRQMREEAQENLRQMREKAQEELRQMREEAQEELRQEREKQLQRRGTKN
ncbi:hypothetical protein E4U34_008001 [Claviceps purpurea]|nr:hypothetical protein E4U34_008001 [Claviceps purpurea]